MIRTPLSIPEIAFIGGTRGLLGAGVGLLLADKLTDDERRAAGWTLLGVGLATTIPIVVQLVQSRKEARRENEKHDGSQRLTEQEA